MPKQVKSTGTTREFMARDIDVHDSTTIGTLHSLSPVAGPLRFQPSSTCKVQNHNVSAITVGAAKTNAVHFFNRCCTRVTQWDINTDQSAAHGHGGVVGGGKARPSGPGESLLAARKENTSADPIIVPELYRRGQALSCRHHASGRCATQSTHTGYNRPAPSFEASKSIRSSATRSLH